MSTHKLYLYENTETPKRLGSSINASYSFTGGRLTVYWRQSKKTVKASAGEAFVINCNGKMPEISQLMLPRNNHRLIMWLCGYGRNLAATDVTRFEEIWKRNRERLKWWGYTEYGTRGAGYCFILATRSDCGGENHIAGYMDSAMKLTTDKVVEVLDAYYQVVGGSYMPPRFVQAVLRNRFGLDSQDFLRIHM